MARFLTIIAIAALLGAGLFVLFGEDFVLVPVRPVAWEGALGDNVLRTPSVPSAEQPVTAPPPLRVEEGSADSALTRSGVIAFTNLARAENGGLTPLAEDLSLNSAARAKLQDMLTEQYFDHVSPDGIGPAHWVEESGYAYVLSGENLALGNFADDATLVDGWMNSPGHRANILNERYEEIGVAVGNGLFEGRTTWLAVQVFAMPLTSCPPRPDATDAERIEAGTAQLDAMEVELTVRSEELENSQPQGRGGYAAHNQKVKEYNALIAEYNALFEEMSGLIEGYNDAVRVFNVCATGS